MDPIADMLSGIKNAQAVKKETVSVSYSKLKMEVAKVLLRSGYLKDVQKKGRKERKTIDLVLAYENGLGKITDLKRVSKPSRRFYLSSKDLKPAREGRGLTIISTTKGLLTDKEARAQNLGGEVLLFVY